MRNLIFLSLVISLISCSFRENDDIVIASLDGNFILLSEIDSIISIDLYNLRLEAIKRILDMEIIKMEAEKLNISVDSFLVFNFDFKSEIILDNKMQPNEIENNRAQYIGHLRKAIVKNDDKNSVSVFKQLRKKHKIEIFLPPPAFRSSKFKNSYSYYWDYPDAKESIIVLFNYDCPVCSLNDDEIRRISRNYSLNLQYIYYTDFVSNNALLCDAALMQNKYWEMHDRLISSSCTESLYSLMVYANSIGVDTVKLKSDSQDKKIIRKHLINKDVIQSMSIYSVPTYIYQNSIFHDIKTLELVLQAQ